MAAILTDMSILSVSALATLSVLAIIATGSVTSGPAAQVATPTTVVYLTPVPHNADIRAVPFPGERPVIPSLTAEQQELLTELALSDPRVQHLVMDRSFAVWDVAPWLTFGALMLLGGVVELRFDQVEELEGEFLGTNYDCSGTHWPPYQVIAYEAVVVGAERLYVTVDLEHRQVVGLFPFPGAIVSGPHVTADTDIWPRTCPGD